MATLDDIRSRVTRIVQDSVYTDEIVDAFINEGLQRCAGLVLLPDLMSTGVVATAIDAYSVPIPTTWNFDRNLYLCSTVVDKRRLEVFSSVALLSGQYPEFNLAIDDREVLACTATRTQFIYYPVPTAITSLQCAFYQKPTLLTVDTAEPSILPEFLHYDLLVNFACFKVFSEIEDGIDGVQVNTTKYFKLFDAAITELSVYFRTGQSRPAPSRRSDWV
ncbi:MAG: hypothetical protein QX194_00705 [Methylococcales bacterium]